MGECFIGFGHLVRLLLAANGGSGVVHGVHELAGEALGHRLARTLARGLDDPAHRERPAAAGTDLDGGLVGRPTDTAARSPRGGWRTLLRALRHPRPRR